jgi:DNA-binding MarR family transcriptional regulator
MIARYIVVVALTRSRLQREIRQTRPFLSPRHEAVLAILRTADQLRNVIAACLAPAGVTMQQYNVLRILRGAGERGLPTLAISERMIESAPGITRLLDRMEKRQWVTRERCPKDRRVVFARLTHAGEHLLAALDEPVARNAATTLPGISDANVAHLIELLAEVRSALSGSLSESPHCLS